MRGGPALSGIVASVYMLGVGGAVAGPNSDSVLFLHVESTLAYTAGAEFCGQSSLLTYGDAVVSASQDTTHVVYLLAAFPPGGIPRLKGASFGIDYDPTTTFVIDEGSCAEFSVPDPGWPETSSGTALSFEVAQTSNLVELYWFAVYQYGGAGTLSVTGHDAGGVIFADDSTPAVQDTVWSLGTLGLGTSGELPPAPQFAPEPTEVRTALVLDADTGLPVSGVWVTFGEDCYRKLCGDAQCTCDAGEYHRTKTGATDAAGVATVVFDYRICEPVGGEPVWYESLTHSEWDLPAVEQEWSEGVYQPWIQTGSNGDGTVLYIMRQSDLVEKFAPVLHSHSGGTNGWEKQDGIADVDEAIQSFGTISLYSVLGGEEYGPSTTWHGWDNHGFWDTFGENHGSITWTRVAFSSVATNLATVNRPLYYNVFDWNGSIVIQYWYFFIANDTRGMWPSGAEGFHYGDWERVAIKLDEVDDRFVPVDLNFYNHEGGRRVSPTDAWWSQSTATTYAGLKQGYDDDHTHLHVWIAANSHGSYNRFDPVYTLGIDLTGTGCDVEIHDVLDYNIADQVDGNHGFFEWTDLVDLGNLIRVSGADVHNHEWIYHNEGDTEFNRFIGQFGQGSKEECPPGCPDELCFLLLDLSIPFAGPLVPRSFGPYTPAHPSQQWRIFHDTPGEYLFGNDLDIPGFLNQGYILYAHQAPRRTYLGEFGMCSDGSGDVIGFDLEAIGAPGQPRVAEVTRVSGDVEFLDSTGSCGMGCWVFDLAPINGGERHRFESAMASGTGRVSISVTPTMASSYDGHEMEAEIVDCALSAVEDGDGHVSTGLVVHENPTRSPVSFSFPARVRPGELRIFSIGGRRVATLPVDEGERTARWDWRAGPRGEASGVYFVQLVEDGSVIYGAKLHLVE